MFLYLKRCVRCRASMSTILFLAANLVFLVSFVPSLSVNLALISRQYVCFRKCDLNQVFLKCFSTDLDYFRTFVGILWPKVSGIIPVAGRLRRRFFNVEVVCWIMTDLSENNTGKRVEECVVTYIFQPRTISTLVNASQLPSLLFPKNQISFFLKAIPAVQLQRAKTLSKSYREWAT